jgi:hypothetical protein
LFLRTKNQIPCHIEFLSLKTQIISPVYLASILSRSLILQLSIYYPVHTNLQALGKDVPWRLKGPRVLEIIEAV